MIVSQARIIGGRLRSNLQALATIHVRAARRADA